MANFLTILIGRLKVIFVNSYNIINQNKDIVNFILMLAIIIVTINSIIATKNSAEATRHSANATNSIRILQESLDRERLNEKINRKIALADNLISELKFNVFVVQVLSDQLNDDYFKNSTETTPARIFKERLLHATNDPEFGNATSETLQPNGMKPLLAKQLFDAFEA